MNMTTMKYYLPAAALALLVMNGCSTGTDTEQASQTTAPATEASYDLVEGAAIYEDNCATCHQEGIMGAPKTTDSEAWQERIAQGMPTLIEKSINGYTGAKFMMPARGGNPELTDSEVANAVAWMVEEAGKE